MIASSAKYQALLTDTERKLAQAQAQADEARDAVRRRGWEAGLGWAGGLGRLEGGQACCCWMDVWLCSLLVHLTCLPACH